MGLSATATSGFIKKNQAEDMDGLPSQLHIDRAVRGYLDHDGQPPPPMIGGFA